MSEMPCSFMGLWARETKPKMRTDGQSTLS